MWTPWADRSLAIRLTTVYIGLVAMLLVADSAILFYETREFLIDSTAIRMRDTAAPRVAEWIPRRLVSGDGTADLHLHAEELSATLTAPTTIAKVIDLDGRVLASGSGGGGNVDLGEDHLAQVARGEHVTVVTGAGPATLATLIPLEHATTGEPVGVVQLTTSLSSVEAILARELIGIAVVVIVTVSLVGIGGYLLTTRALLPLRRVIDTSREIAAGDLSRRVALSRRRDEVGQVGIAFNEMATRIEAAFEVQSRFISDAAHELRTPLTAIQGAMEVLLRGSQDDPAAARQLMRAMYHDTVRLTSLAEQLLDTARLGTPIPLHPEEVDLEAFLAEQTRNAQLLNPRHRVAPEGDASATIAVDVNLLGQALLNLLDNAAQHSPEGSTIWLRRVIEPDVVRISVTDEGDGISPDDLPNVFHSFYRSDRSRSRRRGGAGLGLALVDAIVAAHGGAVQARSKLGAGSTFTITLPIAGADTPRAHEAGRRHLAHPDLPPAEAIPAATPLRVEAARASADGPLGDGAP